MAYRLMQENVTMTRQMCAQLPKNRDLIRKIHDYGMQPI
jgi:tryptophan halogenase